MKRINIVLLGTKEVVYQSFLLGAPWDGVTSANSSYQPWPHRLSLLLGDTLGNETLELCSQLPKSLRYSDKLSHQEPWWLNCTTAVKTLLTI